MIQIQVPEPKRREKCTRGTISKKIIIHILVSWRFTSTKNRSLDSAPHKDPLANDNTKMDSEAQINLGVKLSVKNKSKNKCRRKKEREQKTDPLLQDNKLYKNKNYRQNNLFGPQD